MSGYEERLNENRIKQLITTQVPIGITIMQAPSDLPHHSLQGQGEQPESGSSVGDSAAPLSQNETLPLDSSGLRMDCDRIMTHGQNNGSTVLP